MSKTYKNNPHRNPDRPKSNTPDDTTFNKLSPGQEGEPTEDFSAYADPSVLATPLTRNTLKGEGLNLNIDNRDDEESIPVRLTPSEGAYERTKDVLSDEKLWQLIKSRTVNFNTYLKLMNSLMRGVKNDDFKKIAPDADLEKLANRLPFHSTAAYSVLKFATELYVRYTVDLDKDPGHAPSELLDRSPYYQLILEKLDEYRLQMIQQQRIVLNPLRQRPLLVELLWSYWHEEGMLVQTMNAIARRFQNMRNGPNDPLANLDIDPLRSLNNVLWGYVQDAQHRLTVARRTYEYNHHYGIQLIGTAIPKFSPAESRSRFIEAFHNLLYRASVYYKEADDLTRRADGFHVLNALKEVHLLLSEGSNNQYGELPITAKMEMMIEGWILSQPEIREFLGGRIMTPYDEPWMDRVDTMKTLQGWPSASITYYHDLGRYGEQILLSIRLANWTQVNDRDFASAWASEWRNAIQRYIHCYHSVTGTDIGVDTMEQTEERKYLMPALLIQQKHLREQRMLRR